jgi:hypothetical protein
MKKLFLLMPLMALLMGCACDDEEALSPVLTVEGGQIQGVRAENAGVYVFKVNRIRWSKDRVNAAIILANAVHISLKRVTSCLSRIISKILILYYWRYILLRKLDYYIMKNTGTKRVLT